MMIQDQGVAERAGDQFRNMPAAVQPSIQNHKGKSVAMVGEDCRRDGR